MKKYILLLLLSVSLYGQNPTPFTKIKITGNTTSTTATKVNVQETNGEVNTIAKADLIDYIEYATASALPVTGTDAKIYLTKDDNKLYRWNGTVYTLISGGGGDISGKEDTANKQNSLATDGTATKFPTVDGVNAELDILKSQINPNTYVVTDAGYSQVVQDITINAGWAWKINNVDKTNASPITINIPLAASGYQRIDLIVLNASNTAVRIAGTETTGTPVSPAVPTNTIQILFVVTDSAASTPGSPKPKNQVSQALRNGETNYSPSEDIVYDALALKVDKNTSITGATNTKITYDSKGLITSGTSLTAGDIPNIAESQVTNLVTDLGLKAPLASPTFTGTVSGITKTMVGLSNVDNTSDTAKPVSTAQQTALDLKANAVLTVRKISSNTTLANSDNGTVILLTASCTVTLPNGLMSGFNVSFETQAGVTMTYALGGSVTLINNVGTTMAEKLSHTIVNTGTSNEYLTAGSL